MISTILISSIIPATIPRWLIVLISIPVNILAQTKSQGFLRIPLYLFLVTPIRIISFLFGCLFSQNFLSYFIYAAAECGIKGIGFALVVEVGQLAGQRLPLLRKILRAEASDLSQKQLKLKALSWVGENLDDKEVLVFDAGGHISEVKSASVKRYVLRLASNCTARRNCLPEYSGRGRKPQSGQRVRPLPRQRKGKTLAATEPDFETSFELDGRTIRVHSWSNLVLCDVKVDPERRNFLHLGLF